MRTLLIALLVSALVALAPSSSASADPQLTRAPDLTRFVEAPYPPEELAAGRAGSVVLELTLDATGHVTAASVVETGGAAFDAAALEAVRQFEFTPAEIDGVPSAIRIHYRYVFTPPAPPEPVQTILAGVVRDAATGQPLAGVTVTVGADRSATTDAEGRFELTELAEGEVTISISGEGIPTLQTSESLVAGQRLEVAYTVSVPPPPEEGEESDDFEIMAASPEIRREVVASQISAAEAQSVPGTGGDVLRVVESLPGVGRSAVGSGQLVVWGASPEDTRVYIDGVPVPRLYHEGGVRSVLHPAFVESLALIPGGAGATYGRGLGGVVLVDTEGPSDVGTHGRIGVDLFDASANLSHRTEDGTYAAAAGRYGWLEHLSGLLDEDATAFVPIPQYWDAQARAGHVLDGGATLDVVGLLSGDRYTRGVPNPDPALATEEHRELDFYRLYARYRNDHGHGSVSTVVPWVGYDRGYRSYQYGETVSSIAYDAVKVGLRASHAVEPAPWVTVTSGLDVEVAFAWNERVGSLGLPPREGDIRVFGQPPPDTIATDDYETSQVGVAPWIEASFDAWDERLHITPGLRIDPYVRSVSSRLPVDANSPAVGDYIQDIGVEPRLSVDLEAAERLSLHAAVGRYRRAPSPDDLSAVFGNPQLPVAQSTQTLLGLAAKPIDALEIEVTGFATFSDALAMRSTADPVAPAEALEGSGEGRVLGAQALVRARFEPGIFGWVTYTISRAERKDAPGQDWRLFDYDQTHVLTAVLGWTAEFGLELSGRFRYASGFPRTEVVGAYYDSSRDRYQPTFGEHNAIRLPAFAQLDVRVAYTADIADTELTVYLDLQNATNRANTEEYIYSADYSERAAIRSLPILPVVGVTWSF